MKRIIEMDHIGLDYACKSVFYFIFAIIWAQNEEEENEKKIILG